MRDTRKQPHSLLFISVIKSALCFCAAFLIAFAADSPRSAHAKPNPKYASIVMDADTGIILRERNADKSLHPASLTKVMTLLLTFEALENGTLQLKDRIRISNHAASMVPSKLGLKPGSSIRVKDAIYALVTKSANDVAVALAEHHAGSERNFAKRMTAKARAIGMTRTTFKNASGLHDKRQVTTARDMAKMGQYVINVYPNYYRYFSRKNFSYAGKSYRNHNRLMDTYAGMDGMKTGYISASGFNLIASAKRNDRRIIGVVFGGRSSKSRNAHMKEILDEGFAKIKNIRIARKIPPLPQRKPAYAKTFAAAYNPALKSGFEKLIGQGDLDPASSKRIETGLMAIAAHTQPAAGDPSDSPRIVSAKYKPVSVSATKPWSIQIGAFKSRAASDRAIRLVLDGLPPPYDRAQPVVAPLKTTDGWLFRGRLTGYTKDEALSVCNMVRDCLPVAPQN